jgi:chromosomal replication initiator protein
VDEPVDERGPDIRADAENLWSRVSDALRPQLSEATWNTWFEGVHAISFHEQRLVLTVPNPVAADRIRTSFQGLVIDAAQALAGADITLELLVRPEAEPVDNFSLPGRPEAAPASAPDLPRTAPRSQVNPRYTFEQFVIGASNRFAHAAAQSVAESPSRAYNPLFIYGPSGLGKTHLLHAIAHHVEEAFTTKRVRYVSTEQMMNEFVDAMRAKSVPGFKRRYRDVDVLLLDDVQFLERTEQLQEEFFHTFNDLHASGSQIVISSDRPPRSIAKIEDRLRSRFEWGLLTEIQPPEFETRLAILRKKAESEGLEGIPPEVLAFIAENIAENVRQLEGALVRVAAYSSLNRISLTEEIAQKVLSDLLPSETHRPVTPDVILDETAKMFGWTVEELCGTSRRRPLVSARQIGMYVFRELTDFSYPRIAEVFGGRDHSTVMYACDKVRVQMAEKQHVFEQVNDLISQIKHGHAT